MKTKNILFIILSLALAGVFIWWAFRDLDLQQMWNSIREADYQWVIAAGVFAALAFYLRALRWVLLLKPLGYHISVHNSFWSVSFGYFMNLFIPRSGEVARATSLYGTENVPVNRSFGTIVLERVVDFIFLGMFGLLALGFHWKALTAFFSSAVQAKNTQNQPGYIAGKMLEWGIPNPEVMSKLLIGVVAILILAMLAYVFRNKLGKVKSFLRGILEGMVSVFRMKEKSRFMLLSIGIWLCYYLAAYLVCFSLKETSDFSWTEGVYLIVVGTLGMIIPASGGVGAFHLAMKYGVAALFLSKGLEASAGESAGMAYAIISHGLQTVITIVLGILSAIFIGVNTKRNRENTL